MIDYEMGKFSFQIMDIKKFHFQMPNEDKFGLAFCVREEGYVREAETRETTLHFIAFRR